jgi:hypothetical protein
MHVGPMAPVNAVEDESSDDSIGDGAGDSDSEVDQNENHRAGRVDDNDRGEHVDRNVHHDI